MASDCNVFVYYTRLFIVWLLPNIPALLTFLSPFYVPAILNLLEVPKYCCLFFYLWNFFFSTSLMVSCYLSNLTLKSSLGNLLLGFLDITKHLLIFSRTPCSLLFVGSFFVCLFFGLFCHTCGSQKFPGHG